MVSKRRKTVRERLDASKESVARWRKSLEKAGRQLERAQKAQDADRVALVQGRIDRSTKRLERASRRLERHTENLPSDLKKERGSAIARRGALKLAERVMVATHAPQPQGPTTGDKVTALNVTLDLPGREFRDARRQAATDRDGKRGEAREQTAPAERLVQAEVLEISDNRTVRVMQSPIEVLTARQKISDRQSEAAKRLLSDWHLAGLSPVGSVDPNRTGSGGSRWAPGQMPLSESQAAARRSWRDAVRAMGPDLSVMVVAVVIEAEVTGERLEPLAQRLTGRSHAKTASAALVELLKVGLNVLASHYRIPDTSKRIRGWVGEKSAVRSEFWGPVEEALDGCTE